MHLAAEWAKHNIQMNIFCYGVRVEEMLKLLRMRFCPIEAEALFHTKWWYYRRCVVALSKLRLKLKGGSRLHASEVRQLLVRWGMTWHGKREAMSRWSGRVGRSLSPATARMFLSTFWMPCETSWRSEMAKRCNHAKKSAAILGENSFRVIVIT